MHSSNFIDRRKNNVQGTINEHTGIPISTVQKNPKTNKTKQNKTHPRPKKNPKQKPK